MHHFVYCVVSLATSAFDKLLESTITVGVLLVVLVKITNDR